jgi:dihydroorotase
MTPQTPASETDAPFDLVICGARVIDPAQGLDGRYDVAIRNGKIAALAPDLSRVPAITRLSADGKIVTPGLIDLHVHVYEWVTNFGVRADDAGVDAGVTTIVDQGSSGAWTFGGFIAHVIKPSKTDVVAFPSINLLGAIKGGMEGPRLHNPDLVDIDELAELAAQYPQYIRGFKCHAESGSMSHWGTQVMECAAEIGRRTGLPLYVHTGELFPVIEESRPEATDVVPNVLHLLKPGDVLAHVYSAMPDGIVGLEPGIPDVVKQARQRGLLFDIGYGVNFSYPIARKMISAELYPDTISSDAHGDFNGYHDDSQTDYSLCGAMTRLLALGMPIDRIIAATTITPAKVIGQQHRIGSLRPGMDANITILDQIEGAWTMLDGRGEELVVNLRLAPHRVVMGGEVIVPSCRLMRDIFGNVPKAA